jgi:hypothetical protein
VIFWLDIWAVHGGDYGGIVALRQQISEGDMMPRDAEVKQGQEPAGKAPVGKLDADQAEIDRQNQQQKLRDALKENPNAPNRPALGLSHEDIENIFVYHAPFGNQASRYEDIRAMAKNFSHTVNQQCPPSAEKTLAIRAIQQAAMWANASIAVNEKPPAVDDTGLGGQKQA